MITRKALGQVLAGAQAQEAEGQCYCIDEDCQYFHEEGAVPATHCITYVTPKGALDSAMNKEVLGPRWGLDGDLDTILDFPEHWPDDRDRMVVVERATRTWRSAADYFS